MSNLTPKEIFVSKATKVHGNKYDYSHAKYDLSRIPLEIICPIHGPFFQRPNAHLMGQGCPKCGRLKRDENVRITIEEFIERSLAKHGDRYDYSMVDLRGSHQHVSIICRKHGIFKQTPSKHMEGKGCPRCARELLKYNQMTTKDFIEKAIKVYGNKYDYSLAIYRKANLKVKISCSEHGEFEVTPNNHLRGYKCYYCALTESADKRRSTTEEFIQKALKVHGSKYDYSSVVYQGIDIKVKIVCPEHGEFLRIPSAHLGHRGCPRCQDSRGERKIALFFDANKIQYKRQEKFKGCVYKRLLSFDFYLPKYNACIEYDGKQHFCPVDFYGGMKEFERNQIVDGIKNKFCKNNKIKLLRISYKDKDINSILESVLGTWEYERN